MAWSTITVVGDDVTWLLSVDEGDGEQWHKAARNACQKGNGNINVR